MMPPRSLSQILVLSTSLAALTACGSRPASVTTAPSPPPPPAPSEARIDPQPEEVPPRTCGEMGCRLFDTPAEAFQVVFADNPLIVAIGESHAKKGTEGIASTTARFTNELLPLFKGKASDLVLELWVADGSCGKQEERVAQEQKPVTTEQRETNQNEFVTLGNRSNELGIRPHVLRPSCEEYDKIVNAGPDGVQAMLKMIALMTDQMVRAILVRNSKQGVEKIALAYGGAMHNDLEPRAGNEPFSFGPDLHAYTKGRYVEIDLIVPEFIGESDVWRALPWYEHFDPDAHPDRVTLFEVRPRSYVLIFARTKAGAGTGPQ